MKKIAPILILAFLFSSQMCEAQLSNLTMQAGANRLGVDNKPERRIEVKKIKEAKNDDVKTDVAKKTQENKDVSAYTRTYADVSLKNLANDVADELAEDESVIFADMSSLWLYAAQNSETIKYAIYKLSNPDENKPNENTIKKIIKPIASVSSIAGTAFAANPFVATGAMMSGGLLNAFASNDKDANYRFTKVNDADMVLLTQKIDDLQKHLLNLYIDYRTKKKIYEMAQSNVQKREKIYLSMQNKSKEEIILADVYLRNAQNFEAKAKNDYMGAKTVLEQLTSKKAVADLES